MLSIVQKIFFFWFFDFSMFNRIFFDQLKISNNSSMTIFFQDEPASEDDQQFFGGKKPGGEKITE